MRKLLLTGLVIAFVLSFASVSFAEEVDRVVGDDIEVEEGEFKIVSMPENDEDRPVSDEDQLLIDEQAPDAVVGEDINVEDGEFKIISIDDGDDRVVGDDIEIGEDEAKIVSIDDGADRAVGDDIEIGEDEAKIVSIDENVEGAEENKSKWPVAAGVFAGTLAVAGIVFLVKRAL